VPNIKYVKSSFCPTTDKKLRLFNFEAIQNVKNKEDATKSQKHERSGNSEIQIFPFVKFCVLVAKKIFSEQLQF
jgi:hypothetical protein